MGGFYGKFVEKYVIIEEKNRMRRFGRINIKKKEICINKVNKG